MGNARGFTLLELIIVLLLISLIAGLGAVAFSRSLPSGKLDAAVREMATAFRQARSLAVLQGEPKALTVELEAHRYGITGYPSRTIHEEVGVKVLDPLHGEVTRGDYVFVFHPSGLSEGGALVFSAGKKVVRLTIDPVVGVVSAREQE